MAGRRPADGPRLLTPSAVAGCCGGFVVLGTLQALYGPAIPAFRARFGVTPAVAGLGLSADFAGALVGVVLYHLLLARAGDRRLLAASYALMAAGMILFAIAPSWPLALGAALVTGFGSGGIDYGLNHLFAIGFGRRSAAMLNLLNAHFGVGAVLGPALIGAAGAARYPWLFGAAAAVSLLLIPSLRGVRAKVTPDDLTQRGEPVAGQSGAGEPVAGEHVAGGPPAGEPRAGTRTGLIVAGFVAVYVLYVAIESGVGGWEPTHLEAVGYGASVAATATSGFWLALTVGRFAAVPVSLRWPAPAIVTVCCLGMAAFLLLAAIPAAAPWAYAGLGLWCAPIWATGLPWLTRSAPRVAAASAYVMASSMVGGVAFPPLLGRAIEISGVRAVPLILCALAAACAVLSWWLRRATREPATATRAALVQDSTSANEP
jgi:MFS transporter, FHS family, glucose/mannose:H+ symporter